MNPILTTALERLPHSKKKDDIQFYWRIILDKFKGNEDEVIESLNKACKNESGEDVDESIKRMARRFRVLCRLPELNSTTGLHLWMGLQYGYEFDFLIETVNKKFHKLALNEQLTAIEHSLRAAEIYNDFPYLASCLARAKLPESFKDIQEYLDKHADDTMNRDKFHAFFAVIKTMTAEKAVKE